MTISKHFTAGVLFLVSALIAIAQAQTRNDESGLITNTDSLFSIHEFLPPLSLEPSAHDSGAPASLLRGVYSESKSWMSVPATGHIEPLSLELLIGISPYGTSDGFDSYRTRSWLLDSGTELLTPWKLELQSTEKYQIWRSILGSVQVGGMAYLMYLHFRKYGLK